MGEEESVGGERERERVTATMGGVWKLAITSVSASTAASTSASDSTSAYALWLQSESHLLAERAVVMAQLGSSSHRTRSIGYTTTTTTPPSLLPLSIHSSSFL